MTAARRRSNRFLRTRGIAPGRPFERQCGRASVRRRREHGASRDRLLSGEVAGIALVRLRPPRSKPCGRGQRRRSCIWIVAGRHRIFSGSNCTVSPGSKLATCPAGHVIVLVRRSCLRKHPRSRRPLRPSLGEYGPTFIKQIADHDAVHVCAVNVQFRKRETLNLKIVAQWLRGFLFRAVRRSDGAREDQPLVEVTGDVFPCIRRRACSCSSDQGASRRPRSRSDALERRHGECARPHARPIQGPVLGPDRAPGCTA